MSKKKKSKQNLLHRHAKTVLTLVLIITICAVAYQVSASNHNRADAALTAPMGTAARGEQINGSELSQEQAIDGTYDSGHLRTAGDDSAALSNVGEAVRDAN